MMRGAGRYVLAMVAELPRFKATKIRLTVDGRDYVVSPRGNTQWSRNVRAAGGGELRLGRKREEFRVEELAPCRKKVTVTVTRDPVVTTSITVPGRSWSQTSTSST